MYIFMYKWIIYIDIIMDIYIYIYLVYKGAVFTVTQSKVS